MTRDELTNLRIFLDEFREFREDDRTWKNDIDRRILGVEHYVTSRTAVAERDASRGVSRRAYVASAIAAVGIVVSIALGVANLVA